MKSIRARLTLWNVAVLLLLICIFAVGVYAFVEARLLGQVVKQAEGAFHSIEKVCRHNPSEAYELEAHGGLALYEVLEGDKVLHRTQEWSRAGIQAPLEGAYTWDGRFRVRSGSVNYENRTIRISAAADETGARDALRTLGLILLLGIPWAAVVALGAGYFLAGRVLRPIGIMATKAQEITAERLSDRIPVDNPHDELGQLARIINDTLGRLQTSFEQLRRFTSDASHELRTPLTAIRSVGEVALQSPREGPFYRDVIGSMLEETDRLSRLVDSLLTLTRADAGAVKIATERTDLSALTRSSVEFLRVLADEKEQSLNVNASGEVFAIADPAILRQAIVNLVDNAIKYTPVGGKIDIEVRRNKEGHALIEVRDTGPGIPAAHRERVFERFYRVDPARTGSEGAGLGLAIARWAVDANNGRLLLDSDVGKGSTFTILLPALVPPLLI